jgi:hypothetical protein
MQQVSLQHLLEALGVAALGHCLIYATQHLRADISASHRNPTGLSGMAQRSSVAPLISSSFLATFMPTSSQFLLKDFASDNIVVWWCRDFTEEPSAWPIDDFDNSHDCSTHIG